MTVTDWTARHPRHVETFSWRVALLFWAVGCGVLWGAAAVMVGG